MSKDCDLPEVYDVAKKLLSNGVAMIDGEVKLTLHIMDKMHQEDFEGMVGEYLVNFTLALPLAAMKEKSAKVS